MKKKLMFFATVFCISLAAFCSISLGQNAIGTIRFGDDLSRDLYLIRHPDTGAPVDKNQAERDMLALLSKYSDKKSQGRIYTELAEMFYPLQMEKTRDNKEYLEKSILYTKKAIDLPLPVHRKLELYQQWGGMETHKARQAGTPEINNIQPYLLGLKFAKDQQVPDTKPEEVLYRGETVRGNGGTPIMHSESFGGTPAEMAEHQKRMQAINKKNAEASAAVEAGKESINAFEIKETIERSIVGVYISQPNAVELLRQQAKTVTGNDAIAERLANLLTDAQTKKAEQARKQEEAARTSTIPGFVPWVAP